MIAEVLQQETAEGLRRAMEEAGWTQRQLAERLGLSEPRVSRILSGQENLTLETIANVAAVMGQRVAVTIDPVAVPVSK